MIHHPTNHLERIKIKLRKDEKRQKVKASAGKLWRLSKERDKQKDKENELREAFSRTDLE